MIDGNFVIDSVAHAYNFTPANRRHPELSQALGDMCYDGLHVGFQPPGESRWLLPKDRFFNALAPEFLAHALFAESQTDLAIYHSIPLYGLYVDGVSPLWVGEAMRKLYPGRVLLFGGISPWQDGALEEVDRLIEDVGVVGLKLYPEDIIDGKARPWRLDDPEIAFPLIERARQKGIRSIAIHKAMPLGPVPIEPFLPRDVEGAAIAFPDVTFEIVHGGFAFLEETATQVARFKNVAINLEGCSAFLTRAPRKFAEIVGTFLANGARDRLIWATGAMLYHPRPYIERFWSFQMPRDLVDDYGFPELTDADKRAILGGNQLRLLRLNLDDIRRSTQDDVFSRKARLAEPWTGRYAPATAESWA
jgi:predicted TIM-barrel fold metal-dependent hydrolase